MIFVCPVFPGHTTQLLPFCRLYAFPRHPQPPPKDGFCLLDSGAFGLHQRGKGMDARYITLLARHYARRQADGIFAIMPDQYLNPTLTRERWFAWRRAGRPPVVPVVQFKREKRLDLYSMLRQLEGYISVPERCPRRSERLFICISNPNLTAYDCRQQAMAIRSFRASAPPLWLHNLGAGFSPDDVRRWRDFDCFDSIDSISYYLDAQVGRVWTEAGTVQAATGDWQTLAAESARAAQKLAGCAPESHPS